MPPSVPAPASAEPPFRRLLYRFLFFDWLFADVGAARDPFARHAARQHNRRMARYLPLYLRRWSVVAALAFGLGLAFEQLWQATLLAAVFFSGCCVTVSGMAVIVVAWALLTEGGRG